MKRIICIILCVCSLAVPALAADVYVVDYDIRWYDRTKYYIRFAWKAEIHNPSLDDRRVIIKCNFYDEDGFLLDQVAKTGGIKAWARKEFTGYGIMRRNIIDQIEKTSVSVQAY